VVIGIELVLDAALLLREPCIEDLPHKFTGVTGVLHELDLLEFKIVDPALVREGFQRKWWF
jgi:hypothetical protein